MLAIRQLRWRLTEVGHLRLVEQTIKNEIIIIKSTDSYLSGLSLQRVFDRLDVDGVFVCQIVEDVVGSQCGRTHLFASKDEVNPLVQVSSASRLIRTNS